MILALLGVAASAASIDCVSEQGQLAAWRPAIEAYRSRDMPKAKAAADAIIAGCGDSPLATIARTMRAEIAVTEGDHDGALALLGSQPRPEAAPAGPYTSLIALRACQGKKDASRFADERTRLLEGSAKGLGAPGNAFKSRLIETFDTNGVRVSAFETDFADGRFVDTSCSCWRRTRHSRCQVRSCCPPTAPLACWVADQSTSSMSTAVGATPPLR